VSQTVHVEGTAAFSFENYYAAQNEGETPEKAAYSFSFGAFGAANTVAEAPFGAKVYASLVVLHTSIILVLLHFFTSSISSLTLSNADHATRAIDQLQSPIPFRSAPAPVAPLPQLIVEAMSLLLLLARILL
jgi:hypothetical protein